MRQSKGRPELGQIIFYHNTWCKYSYSCLVLGVSNPVQNNVLDLEVSVGALFFFFDRFPDGWCIIVHKLGAMPSNFLHHLMSQNTRKNEKVNLLNLTPYNTDFLVYCSDLLFQGMILRYIRFSGAPIFRKTLLPLHCFGLFIWTFWWIFGVTYKLRLLSPSL